MSRERLTKLLGMLGSDFDGERANAARMIADMAKKEGKGVADYVMGGGGPQIIYRDRVETVYRDRPCAECARRAKEHAHDTRMYTEDDLRNYKPKGERFNFDNLRRPGQSQARKARGAAEIMAGLRDAQDYPEHLTGWEMEFVEDILRKFTFDYELSDKQTKTARKIIAKIAAAEDGESLI